MRSFSDFDQEVVKQINEQQGNKSLTAFFSKKCLSLATIAIFSLDINTAYILKSSSCKDNIINNSLQKLISLLSLLDYLEQEGMIYVVDSYSQDKFMLYEEEDSSVGISEDKSLIFGNGTIKLDKNSCIVKDISKTRIMSGELCSRLLASKIRHFFLGEIYDTLSLQELIKNQFKQLEIIEYEREIKNAKLNLCYTRIALFISLLSPILGILCSNAWGVSTITESQYIPIEIHFKRTESTLSNINNELNAISNKLNEVVSTDTVDYNNEKPVKTSTTTSKVRKK